MNKRDNKFSVSYEGHLSKEDYKKVRQDMVKVSNITEEEASKEITEYELIASRDVDNLKDMLSSSAIELFENTKSYSMISSYYTTIIINLLHQSIHYSQFISEATHIIDRFGLQIDVNEKLISVLQNNIKKLEKINKELENRNAKI